ncbi:sensor histidine kinase [Glycomyces algeriensis]|uniref:histidine kinase n=1 Tax=Glycomyces algeriensis TaxID=256037 RepID=A0A9W6LF31_9ACTN|nr:histidine kinase [Glycomyces algeriensis]MDA1368039.1 histidine kinase [Glycomyces algeriensis]MDR7352549.1 signal transduction histidine kinase [Glycomyces algeriensis]GLI40229.1 two-component sensor histidine kinase [Glycomyces algeriensis]
MTWGKVRAWTRKHAAIIDVVVAVAFVGLFFLGYFRGDEKHGPPIERVDFAAAVHVAAAATALASLSLRRYWPERLLILDTIVSVAIMVATGYRHPLLIVTWMIVAYTFARTTGRRRVWLVAGACIAAMFVAAGLFGGSGWISPETFGLAAWSIAFVAIGDATRSRRAYIDEVEERARRAEDTREEEARRRVAEERLRIARELHDVVAHHIAVINVQAGAAAHVLQTRPEAVGPALAHIRRAADTVMQELGSVVGVLRADDGGGLDESTEPTRGLARLAELLDSFAAAGLRVEHRQSGTARDLPAVVDLAAYRIVQESLTNAHKYGTGRARLAITYAPDAVRIEVENPIAKDAEPNGSGYGLVGMRERAAATGGTVTAGAEGDRFAVRAELPATAKETP